MDVNVSSKEKEAFKINRVHMFPLSSGHRRDELPAV